MVAKLIMSISLMMMGTHPIHVAVTQIDHNAAEKTLQVTHKVFVDDFENRLEELYQADLEIGLAEEHAQCDEYIQKYLSTSFKMTVNGKSTQAIWVGKEVEGAALWVYVEYPNIKRVKNIKLENRILFEAFNDQKNLVHFNYKGIKKSLVHQKDEALGEVDF
ncbi:MAG: DUF6702 family protein [Flammeovirgaceae bacterium]